MRRCMNKEDRAELEAVLTKIANARGLPTISEVVHNVKRIMHSIEDVRRSRDRLLPTGSYHKRRFMGRKITALLEKNPDLCHEDVIAEALEAREAFMEKMSRYASMTAVERFAALIETYIDLSGMPEEFIAQSFEDLTDDEKALFQNDCVPAEFKIRKLVEAIKPKKRSIAYANMTPRDRYNAWTARNMPSYDKGTLEEVWNISHEVRTTFEQSLQMPDKVPVMMELVPKVDKERRYAIGTPWDRFYIVMHPLVPMNNYARLVQMWGRLKDKSIFDRPTMPDNAEMQLISMMASMM